MAHFNKCSTSGIVHAPVYLYFSSVRTLKYMHFKVCTLLNTQGHILKYAHFEEKFTPASTYALPVQLKVYMLQSTLRSARIL